MSGLLKNSLMDAAERAGSWRKLGDLWGIDHAYLYRIALGEKQPNDVVLRRLGLIRVVAYRRNR